MAARLLKLQALHTVVVVGEARLKDLMEGKRRGNKLSVVILNHYHKQNTLHPTLNSLTESLRVPQKQ